MENKTKNGQGRCPNCGSACISPLNLITDFDYDSESDRIRAYNMCGFMVCHTCGRIFKKELAKYVR